MTTGKQSRYLREMDRRNILERLALGEKQADLAKEFNVSRAAICNLNKHRDAVLSRQNEHPLAKHPKRRGYKKANSTTKAPQRLGTD
jgi:Zn-dependent peptidase ImmA (M78 family)